MNWHLGRYQFPADDLRFLLCGASRTAYVALTGDGDLIELAVRIKPEQAALLIHGGKTVFEKTLHARIGPEAPAALQVSLDLLPARSGSGYADGQNTYPRAKREARARAFQAGARKSLQAAKATDDPAKLKPTLQWLERFREDIANAWLEAEGYRPWLAISDACTLDFAIRAYADAATLAQFNELDNILPESLRQLNALAAWNKLDVVSSLFSAAVVAKLRAAESLATQVDNVLRIAESRGWPMIERRARR